MTWSDWQPGVPEIRQIPWTHVPATTADGRDDPASCNPVYHYTRASSTNTGVYGTGDGLNDTSVGQLGALTFGYQGGGMVRTGHLIRLQASDQPAGASSRVELGLMSTAFDLRRALPVLPAAGQQFIDPRYVDTPPPGATDAHHWYGGLDWESLDPVATTGYSFGGQFQYTATGSSTVNYGSTYPPAPHSVEFYLAVYPAGQTSIELGIGNADEPPYVLQLPSPSIPRAALGGQDPDRYMPTAESAVFNSWYRVNLGFEVTGGVAPHTPMFWKEIHHPATGPAAPIVLPSDLIKTPDGSTDPAHWAATGLHGFTAVLAPIQIFQFLFPSLGHPQTTDIAVDIDTSQAYVAVHCTSARWRYWIDSQEPHLRLTQRNDGLGSARNPRLLSSPGNAPSSVQRTAAPRLGTNDRYR